MLLSNRSGARRSLGDSVGALEDANAAAELAPPGFHTAYVRQVRVLRHLVHATAATRGLLCRLHRIMDAEATMPVQVEAYADLRKYREADTALEAAARRDPSFASTQEYKRLTKQLAAYRQGLPR
jgi:hypothetical protein